MSTKYTHLFTPFKIGNMTVKNRFVLPAMGLKKFESKGSISAEGIEYFTQFAKGGFGAHWSATPSLLTLRLTKTHALTA